MPLNATGRAQAAELAERAPPTAFRIVEQPAAACAGNRGIVAARIGLNPVEDARLMEPDSGDWTDRSFADVNAEAPELFAAFVNGDASFAFPGGESFAEQEVRVSAALDEVETGAAARAGGLPRHGHPRGPVVRVGDLPSGETGAQRRARPAPIVPGGDSAAAELADLGGGEATIASRAPPPAQVRRQLTTEGLPLGPGMVAKYRASAQAFLDMIALLHANGIRIVAGTDDVLPGFDLVRELELYAQAGIPRAQVLQFATIQPARVMRMDDALGSLRPGKQADAILVWGDPLADIAKLRRVGTTIKGGVMYDTRALYATAGVTAPDLG